MAFESLSYRHTLAMPAVPHRWIPLIHLYDPDLPLFPIFYFHTIADGIPKTARPPVQEHVFGYVERANVGQNGGIEVSLVLNKDLGRQENIRFKQPVEKEVQERFGIANPVRFTDVRNVFRPPLDRANRILEEMWHRSVANAYGDMLPFGRLWDETLGLARWVASWNSQSGRKGELIQTHYFASKFGVPLQSAGGIPQVDFYLLPTVSELTNRTNPLSEFIMFGRLIELADIFAQAYGQSVNVGGLTLTAFKRPFAGALDTEKLHKLFNGARVPQHLRPTAFECFNAFGKGPGRTVLFLLMLHDLRNGLLKPSTLTAAQCGSIYDGLSKSYQSPKVIQIYAQQSFGNTEAMPIDTWIETFFKWPLNVYPQPAGKKPTEFIFSHATRLGKVERLLWVVGQARKVHSSACNDAVWCTKYGSEEGPRGANPLACNICLSAIRDVCPAYDAIRRCKVSFNNADVSAEFQIQTSSGNNTDANQTFLGCSGFSIYQNIVDKFSPADSPQGFAPYPASPQTSTTLDVEEFVRNY